MALLPAFQIYSFAFAATVGRVLAGIEVKGQKTPVTDAQQALTDAEYIEIARSVEAAEEAVKRVEAVMMAVARIRET